MVRGVDLDKSIVEFIQIIKAVGARPSLYHKKNSEHRHYARMKTWAEIGKEVNLPALICKKRWRYARNLFVRNARNETIGKTAMQYLPHLHFLEGHITIKKEPFEKRMSCHMAKKMQNLENFVLVPSPPRIPVKVSQNINRIKMRRKKLLKKRIIKPRVNEEYTDTFSKLQQIRKNATMKSKESKFVDRKLEPKSDPESDVIIDDEPVLEFIYDKREQRIREFSREDSDLHFLKSLLCEINLMNFEQRKLFKTKMISLVRDVLLNKILK